MLNKLLPPYPFTGASSAGNNSRGGDVTLITPTAQLMSVANTHRNIQTQHPTLSRPTGDTHFLSPSFLPPRSELRPCDSVTQDDSVPTRSNSAILGSQPSINTIHMKSVTTLGQNPQRLIFLKFAQTNRTIVAIDQIQPVFVQKRLNRID